MKSLTLKTYEAHPKGSYKAVITQIEEKDSQFGPALQITFQTDEGDAKGLFNCNYSAKSKLGRLVLVCLGKMPQEFHPSELKGSELRILVEHTKGEDGQTYDKITEFASLETKDPFVTA